MTREDDAVAGHLVQRLAPAGGAGDAGCPDDNTLSAFLEARLEPHAHAALERHLAACEPCRAVVAEALALRRGISAPQEAAEAVERTWRTRRLLPYAAAALLVIGLGVAGVMIPGIRTGRVSDDAALTVAAMRLRTEHADLFAGFEPLSEEERRSIAPSRLRGSLAVLRPAETILDARPGISWVASPGATGYDVSLSPEGGPVLWRQTVGLVTAAAFPADARNLVPSGKYVVRVETRGPLGRSEATRRFAVADEETRARFAKALTVLDSEHAALRAHFAIRRGFLVEAERILNDRLEDEPGDAIAQETLLYVHRRLGVPEP
jgi:hypothetical protein